MDNPKNPHESDRSADQGTLQEPQLQDVQPTPSNQALLDSLAELDRKFREGIEVLTRFRETLATEVGHLHENKPVSETEERLNRELAGVEAKLAECMLMLRERLPIRAESANNEEPEQTNDTEAEISGHVSEVVELIDRDSDEVDPDTDQSDKILGEAKIASLVHTPDNGKQNALEPEVPVPSEDNHNDQPNHEAESDPVQDERIGEARAANVVENPDNGEQAALGLQENNRASSRHDQILPRQSSETVPRKSSIALEAKQSRPWKSMSDLRVLRGMQFPGFLENKEIVPVETTERSAKLNQLLRSSPVAFETFFKILEDNSKSEFKKKRPWVSMSRLDDPKGIKVTFLEEEDEIVVHEEDQCNLSDEKADSGSSEHIPVVDGVQHEELAGNSNAGTVQEDQVEDTAQRNVYLERMVVKFNVFLNACQATTNNYPPFPNILKKVKGYYYSGSLNINALDVYRKKMTGNQEKDAFYQTLIDLVTINDTVEGKLKPAKNIAFCFLLKKDGTENADGEKKVADFVRELDKWVIKSWKKNVDDYLRGAKGKIPSWKIKYRSCKQIQDLGTYYESEFFKARMAFHENVEGSHWIAAQLAVFYRFLANARKPGLNADFNLLSKIKNEFGKEVDFDQEEKDFFLNLFNLTLQA